MTIYIFIHIVLLLHIVYATYWYATRITVSGVQAQLLPLETVGIATVHIRTS